MHLSEINGDIKIEIGNDFSLVGKIKSIPGRWFYKDPITPYWTVPGENHNYMRRALELNEGHFYPDCVGFINPNAFAGTKIDVKHDRLKIVGKRADYVVKSIQALCMYYETFTKWDARRNKVASKTLPISLAQVIYNKGNIRVITFPVGLYDRVVSFLSYFAVPVTVYPYPEAPEPTQNYKLHATLRPYQAEAVESINEVPRATLVLATGGGKTILSAGIIEKLQQNTIFYVYSTDLLYQTARTFKSVFNQEIGIIGDKKFELRPITVASVPTVHSWWTRKNPRWPELEQHLSQVQLAFIDEGHMLGAETILEIAQLTNAYYTYALTATPFREDGKDICIEAGAGRIIELVPEERLVKEGYILPVNVYLVGIRHKPTRYKRYQTIYKHSVVQNKKRNQKIAEVAARYSDCQTIILVKEIKHGQILANMTGYPFIHGSSKDRKELLEAFKEGRVSCLIATSILKQGIDIPEAEVLILAHGGAGEVELIQKIGRVRRPASGKRNGLVIDFRDQGIDVLERQFEKRLAIYQKRKYLIMNTVRPERSASNRCIQSS